ncbi:MAG: HAMP domain-containing protein [Sphingomonadales bacterium]|nr:HAMP domain-containing protein [Sphingomonadales bacterium]MDE2170555.1 HAMP domain-containing protein [Sphingomonadales bacterium]
MGGPPLGLQMIAMLVCTLVAAQLVTLALTMLIPPRAEQRWDMGDVATALSGQALSPRLEQARLDGPPDVAGTGWLVSDEARAMLARRLKLPEADVVLAFYTQLPVGGVAAPVRHRAPLATRAPETLSSLLIPQVLAQTTAAGPAVAFPGGPMSGAVFQGGMAPGGFPVGGMPGALPGVTVGRGMAQAINGGAGGERRGATGLPAGARMPRGAMLRGMPRALPDTAMPSGGAAMNPLTIDQLHAALAPRRPMAADAALVPTLSQTPAAPVLSITRTPPLTHPRAPVALPAAAPLPTAAPATVIKPALPDTSASEKPQPIPFRSQPQGLLDRASPPFIEGDFVAAARRPDGHWIAVAPRAEGFPNRWQKQVLAWFVLSLLIVSPLAWFFARRIVLPLEGFARAAEILGRDPSATIIPLKGPAEIGRAAHAFNQMHNRLRAFVDDRTAMVGAISHDLRTPLTRLRFRLEDVPDDQRPALLREVAEMESMINEVILFIRDASTPGVRQKVDLAALVADTVADARLVGGDVEVIADCEAPVEVDPVGIRRLLGNLLENAVKYGERARVRVTLRHGEAVAEILDAGPGIAEEEMDRVFEPFYRSPEARRSGRPGSGLGLTVCRSIARAHGGDVHFARRQDGFAAVLSVPVVYDARPRLAA